MSLAGPGGGPAGPERPSMVSISFVDVAILISANKFCRQKLLFSCILLSVISFCFSETLNLSNGGISESQEKMIDAVKNEVSVVLLHSHALMKLILSQNYDRVAALAADAKQRKEYEQVKRMTRFAIFSSPPRAHSLSCEEMTLLPCVIR